MTVPDLSGMGAPPAPRWLGVRELRLGDDWRARWADAESLPTGEVVAYAYAVVLSGDKGYVTRQAGAENWDVLEGEVPPGANPQAWVKEAARDRIGATADRLELLGYFECRATSFNPQYTAGAVTLRPFYILSAKKVADQPRDRAWERRRLPINEFQVAVRKRYPIFEEYLSRAIERYLVWRAKGEL